MVRLKSWCDAELASGASGASESEAGRASVRHTIRAEALSVNSVSDNALDYMDETSWQNFLAELNYMPI